MNSSRYLYLSAICLSLLITFGYATTETPEQNVTEYTTRSDISTVSATKTDFITNSSNLGTNELVTSPVVANTGSNVVSTSFEIENSTTPTVALDDSSNTSVAIYASTTHITTSVDNTIPEVADSTTVTEGLTDVSTSYGTEEISTKTQPATVALNVGISSRLTVAPSTVATATSETATSFTTDESQTVVNFSPTVTPETVTDHASETVRSSFTTDESQTVVNFSPTVTPETVTDHASETVTSFTTDESQTVVNFSPTVTPETVTDHASETTALYTTDEVQTNVTVTPSETVTEKITENQIVASEPSVTEASLKQQPTTGRTTEEITVISEVATTDVAPTIAQDVASLSTEEVASTGAAVTIESTTMEYQALTTSNLESTTPMQLSVSTISTTETSFTGPTTETKMVDQSTPDLGTTEVVTTSLPETTSPVDDITTIIDDSTTQGSYISTIFVKPLTTDGDQSTLSPGTTENSTTNVGNTMETTFLTTPSSIDMSTNLLPSETLQGSVGLTTDVSLSTASSLDILSTISPEIHLPSTLFATTSSSTTFSSEGLTEELQETTTIKPSTPIKAAGSIDPNTLQEEDKSNSVISTEVLSMKKNDWASKDLKFREYVASAVTDTQTRRRRQSTAKAVTAEDVKYVEPTPQENGDDLEIQFVVLSGSTYLPAAAVIDRLDKNEMSKEIGVEFGAISVGIPKVATAQDPEEATSPDDNASGLFVAVIIIAVFSLIILIFGLFYIVYDRRRERRGEYITDNDSEVETGYDNPLMKEKKGTNGNGAHLISIKVDSAMVPMEEQANGDKGKFEVEDTHL